MRVVSSIHQWKMVAFGPDLRIVFLPSHFGDLRYINPGSRSKLANTNRCKIWHFSHQDSLRGKTHFSSEIPNEWRENDSQHLKDRTEVDRADMYGVHKSPYLWSHRIELMCDASRFCPVSAALHPWSHDPLTFVALHLRREHSDGLYPKDEVVRDSWKRHFFVPPRFPDAFSTHGAVSWAGHLIE